MCTEKFPFTLPGLIPSLLHPSLCSKRLTIANGLPSWLLAKRRPWQRWDRNRRGGWLIHFYTLLCLLLCKLTCNDSCWLSQFYHCCSLWFPALSPWTYPRYAVMTVSERADLSLNWNGSSLCPIWFLHLCCSFLLAFDDLSKLKFLCLWFWLFADKFKRN
jgi:hypothetical protein